MQTNIVDTLLMIGVPVNVKGFLYIHDAIELMEQDSSYVTGKICTLYETIARKRNTTKSRVECAIRHAFHVALKNGERTYLEYYLGHSSTKNSSLLRVLHLRIQQDKIVH